jgi:hypothetical protein
LPMFCDRFQYCSTVALPLSAFVTTYLAVSVISTPATVRARGSLVPHRGNRDVTHSGREFCALTCVTMGGTQEPSRSSDDDFPRGVATSPPIGGSGSV